MAITAMVEGAEDIRNLPRRAPTVWQKVPMRMHPRGRSRSRDSHLIGYAMVQDNAHDELQTRMEVLKWLLLLSVEDSYFARGVARMSRWLE